VISNLVIAIFFQNKISYVCSYFKLTNMKKLILLIAIFASGRSIAQLTPATPGITYGAKINATNAISVEDLVVTLSNSDEFSGKIKGRVVSVCQKKGCWMKLANTRGEEIMIKFEDYGFFVPADIDGKEIVLNGVGKKSVTSVSKLQHYAKDAGKSAEEVLKITEPKSEIIFTASGVLVL
jgi:Domain of unknown function (DUF4920)